MPAQSDRDPLVDFIKAFASQLIVVHHLASYGPMADAVYPALPDLLQWLRDYPLMAVQSFLVLGGYLAARSQARMPTAAAIPAILWRRYLRLMLPFAVALAAAIAAAAAARLLTEHDDTPAAPTLVQIVIHLLLLQDVVKQPSLSLGVWYVGIDMQLHAVLLMLLWLGGRSATLWVAALTAASLLWVNSLPEMEIWAPYFFGAYGLGYLVQRLAAHPERPQALAMAWLLAALVAAAMIIDWRDRLLVAGATACLLFAAALGPRSWRWPANGTVAWLGRISYAVFLIHYPVALLVGALVERLWPDVVAVNAAGLVGTWLLSLAAATVLHNGVERRPRLRAPLLPRPAEAG